MNSNTNLKVLAGSSSVNMVCVVIVNYNGWEDTIACVHAVLDSEYDEYKIIIVDNASSNDSFSKLQDHFSFVDGEDIPVKSEQGKVQTGKIMQRDNMVLIQALNNAGFAAGNNIALKWIKLTNLDFQYVWLLNNDTTISPGALGAFVNRMEHETKKLGILGGKLFYYYQKNVLQGVGGLYNRWLSLSKHIGVGECDEGQYNVQDLKMDYIIGASMFIRKQFIVDVGLMCEDYFLYFEELDWILRGKRKGWTIGYEPQVKVYHKEGASTSHNKLINTQTDTYFVRNKFLFTYKHYPVCLLTVFPMIVFSCLLRMKRGRYHQIKAIASLIGHTVKEISSGKIQRDKTLNY